MSKNHFWNKDDQGMDKDKESIAASETGTYLSLKKIIKNGSRLQAAWGLFSEYSNSSTIHGIKYLGEKRRSWVERVWWIFVFSISLYGCGKLIFDIYKKWDQSPVIVSFAEKSTPIWQIPFPAVTICPETKAKSKFLNITELYHFINGNDSSLYNLTDTELSRLTAVSQVCDPFIFENMDPENRTTCVDCVKDLKEMAVPFDEMLMFCKYRNDAGLCTEFFEEIMTEEGICYTFNAMRISDIYRDESISEDFNFLNHSKVSVNWTMEEGYKPDSLLDDYPRRAMGAGARVGLFTLLRLYEYDLDYICRGPVQGFKILLHTPGEMPQVSKQYFRVPLNQEVLVAIKPQMMTTSEGLRHYSPNRRQCYFNNERDLRYFKVYTQRNCELECLANFTLKQCDCVKFNMPRFPGVEICGADKITCYNMAEDDLIKKEIRQELDDKVDKTRGRTDCNCLPACTSITYDAEISQADFNWTALFDAFHNPRDEFPNGQLARLSLFFKEGQFITSKRSELYGRTDFLANCGGLLGLFMGVSLISILEIFYFCTIRLACNLRMRRQKSQKLGGLSPMPSIIVEKPIADKDHLN